MKNENNGNNCTKENVALSWHTSLKDTLHETKRTLINYFVHSLLQQLPVFAPEFRLNRSWETTHFQHAHCQQGLSHYLTHAGDMGTGIPL